MKKLLAYITIFLLVTTSCFAELPYPDDNGIEMHLGESYGGYYAEVKLYYESTNGMELTSVTRTVYVPVGGTIAEAALDALFADEEENEFIHSMPGDASVIGFDINCGIATVDLSVNMSALRDEGELVALVIAVTNTLAGIDGIEYVNVLINGRQESFSSLPIGTLQFESTATSTVWSVLQVESGNFIGTSNPQISIIRNATVYFPSSNGQWILPEVRSISFEDRNFSYKLLTELMNGPNLGSAYSGFIASGSGIIAADPQFVITPSGERVLEIRFNTIVRDYLLLQGISEWQMAASVTMTMTGFLPETDAVRIYIGDEAITQLNIRGYHHEFTDGLLRRSDFAAYTGSTCTLYFASDNATLCAAQRSISSERSMSPYALIVQLIAGPSSTDYGAERIMPAGVTVGDLLGVTVTDGVACVNMSANFYRLCQALNEPEEELLVYSIVNTLCELPGINAVSIVIEGERVETLSGSIYLISDLMPNPGIVRTE